MKTKLMVVVSVMALLLCSASMIAYAQGPGGPGGKGHGWGGPGGMGLALHELNLTDTQKAQVKTIMQANHASMKAVMTQMEQNHAAMLAATANGAYDAAKIQTLANQRAQLDAVMTVNRQSVEHQIYTQVLTADQQAKAEQLRTQAISRINEHLQKMASGTDTAAPPEN
ncbi:MAG: Spy/CpxP family protein refolding chaperone [Candidatus Korobacteraceae bacterium]